MRRSALLAAAAALVGSTLVGVSTTVAHADPESGVTLPAGPSAVAPTRVRLVGDLVYATWDSALYATPADGTGSWTPVTDPVSGDPIQNPRSYWDGVVMTQPADPDHPSCPALHFATRTQAWSTAPECFSGISIGSMGRLVALSQQDPTTHETTTSVYDAESGPAGGALVTTADRIVLAGTWVWRVENGVLIGHDTSAVVPDRSVPIGAPCPEPTLVSVFGDPSGGSARARVDCGQESRIVDVTGASAPLVLSRWAAHLLGDGFVGTPPTVGTEGALSVTDYSKNPVIHEYGPGTAFITSDTGAPRVAWVDGTSVHVAAVPTQPPLTAADDHAAPTVESVYGPAPVVGDPRFPQGANAYWTGSDDESAPPTYRLQVSRAGGAPSTWADVPGYEDTVQQVADVAVAAHEKTCLRVQAVDRVGNRSPWAMLGCTVLDTEVPVVRDVRLSVGPVLPPNAEFTLRYRGVDDGGVDLYDVQRRDAPGKGSFGAWHSPQGWFHIFDRHVTGWMGSRAHESCFRVRAHDHVGHVSAWSRATCLATPYEDRSFVLQGHARHARVSGAIGLRVTVLSGRGAFMWRPVGTGREVWVLASGVSTCPHVWWGGHQVMADHCAKTAGTALPGYRWFHVRTTASHTGRLVIGPDSSTGVVRVDAVAVFR